MGGGVASYGSRRAKHWITAGLGTFGSNRDLPVAQGQVSPLDPGVQAVPQPGQVVLSVFFSGAQYRDMSQNIASCGEGDVYGVWLWIGLGSRGWCGVGLCRGRESRGGVSVDY